MTIPFVPYKKEYAEQMRILVALLGGKLTSRHSERDQPPSPYPRLTGLYQKLPVQIRVIEETTRQGDDPLSTEKYLDILFESPCSLEVSIQPGERLGWLQRLLWWKKISTGEEDLDGTYAITSSEARRARPVMAHKKVKSQILHLAPFSGLWIHPDHIQLQYRITSHQVFTARHLAEVLRRLLRLSRLCQNLS
jgi:hypothetical protein